LRPITALLAALALLAVAPAASFAQTPTPTPSPTASTSQDDGEAEPPSDASKEVKAIYTDYSRDGVIDFCDHERTDLQEALDTIEADFDRDFPDFREALEAGLRDDDCEAEATPTPTATATPDDSTADPTATPDTGALPDPDTGTDDGSGALPPDDGTLPPDDGGALPEEGALPEAGTEQPPAAAAPTAAPPAAATTPAPNPTPAIVTRSGTDALMIPGILIGVALLGAAALAFSAFRGGNPRVQHAWSEARYRTRSTWADFSDWLKLGR
jgi:hypothetical protein